MLFCALAGVVLLSACGASGQAPRPPTRLSWDEILRKTTVAATSHGASPEQLAVIASGRVTFEDYEVAVRRTLACLESNGIDTIGSGVTRAKGYPEIAYSYAASSPGRTDEQTDEVAQRCINQHSLFVEGLYRDSPEVQAAMDQAFESRRTRVIECLEKQGLRVAATSTRSDLEFYAVDVLSRTGVSCMNP